MKFNKIATYFFILWLMPTYANAVYIYDLNGPPSAFLIKREGQKLHKIGPLKPLQVGDKITVRKPTHDFEHLPNKDNFITLALDDGRLKTLTYADTQEKPYSVPTTVVDSPNLVDGIMNSFSISFNRLWKNHIQAIQLYTQDGNDKIIPLSMRLFKGNNAKLLAGNRALHLAWYDGKPPYQVRISSMADQTVIWNQKTQTTEIHFEKQQIAVGRYQVVVTDSQGAKVTGEFTAVTEALPLSPEIEQSRLPELSKKTLQAAWLAKEGGWHFEAYQQVTKITGYYPAQLVKLGLERGKRP